MDLECAQSDVIDGTRARLRIKERNALATEKRGADRLGRPLVQMHAHIARAQPQLQRPLARGLAPPAPIFWQVELGAHVAHPMVSERPRPLEHAHRPACDGYEGGRRQMDRERARLCVALQQPTHARIARRARLAATQAHLQKVVVHCVERGLLGSGRERPAALGHRQARRRRQRSKDPSAPIVPLRAGAAERRASCAKDPFKLFVVDMARAARVELIEQSLDRLKLHVDARARLRRRLGPHGRHGGGRAGRRVGHTRARARALRSESELLAHLRVPVAEGLELAEGDAPVAVHVKLPKELPTCNRAHAAGVVLRSVEGRAEQHE